jgi:uncharacterized protein YcbX
MPPTGAVMQLWRWAVKSMAGEQVGSMRVDARGAGGDRTHALWTERKGRPAVVTARETRSLLRWQAGYPDAPGDRVAPDAPPMATVRAPDGRMLRWDDPLLRPALEADLGLPLTLRRDLSGQQDLSRTLLVTTEASRLALERELGVAIDLRRFRPNVHLRLDAPAYAELEWEGTVVHLAGGVTLRLLHPCIRCAIPTRDPDSPEVLPQLLRYLAEHHGTCFGINARVEVPGRIEHGEAVTVEPPEVDVPHARAR